MTPEEFAKQIKTKYPQYADVDDTVLTNKVLQKYPQYQSKVQGASVVEPAAPTYSEEFMGTGERVAERFKERGQQFKTSFQENEARRQTPLETGAQFAGTALGAVGDVAMEGAKMLTPEWIENVLASAPEAVAKNPNIARSLQEIQKIAKENPRLARNLSALTNIISAIPLGKGGQVGGKAALEATQTGAMATAEFAVKKGTQVAEKVAEKGLGTSEALIANINRINPTKRQEFLKQQGVPEETWLRERGIVGTRQDTIKTLADRFTESKKNVDTAIEQIPGTHRDPRISVVADEAADYAKGIEHPEVGRMSELAQKAKGEGLTTSEINEVKRFYERYIKTGYKKDPTKTSEMVQRATNRDSGIREALFDIADKAGFTNLREMNKEIQASKFLADEIAGKMQGQGANNALTLTDWITITPGAIDPSFLAGFATKKFLSTETVRAFAAKALAGFPKVKPIAVPDFAEISSRARTFLEKTAKNKAEQEQLALLADELQKAGIKMSEGTKGFLTKNPIPLTKEEQALIKAARNKAEQEQMVQYILEQRAEGKVVGEGFTMKNLDDIIPFDDARLESPLTPETFKKTPTIE